MNRINATLTEIQSVESLNIVSFTTNESHLQMMSLSLSKKMLVGSRVMLSVKPTNIALAKSISGVLSYSNQLKVKILSIDKGKLLSSVLLDFEGNTLESIITTTSLIRMDLLIDDSIMAIIKSSDLSIESVIV